MLHNRIVHGARRARAPFTSVLSGELLMRLLARATAPSAADTAAFRIVMPASAPRYSVFMDCEAAPQEAPAVIDWQDRRGRSILITRAWTGDWPWGQVCKQTTRTCSTACLSPPGPWACRRHHLKPAPLWPAPSLHLRGQRRDAVLVMAENKHLRGRGGAAPLTLTPTRTTKKLAMKKTMTSSAVVSTWYTRYMRALCSPAGGAGGGPLMAHTACCGLWGMPGKRASLSEVTTCLMVCDAVHCAWPEGPLIS